MQPRTPTDDLATTRSFITAQDTDLVALLARLCKGHGPDRDGWCRHPAHAHRWQRHPCSILQVFGYTTDDTAAAADTNQRDHRP